MIRELFIYSSIFMSSIVFAGGNNDYAKIKNISYKSSGAIVMEFENLAQDKHFMSIFPKDVKKLRFLFGANSGWLKKILSKDNDSRQFEECINWMIQNYKDGTAFQFGQDGGGDFKLVEDSKDEVVIPNLILSKTRDGKEQVCLIKND